MQQMIETEGGTAMGTAMVILMAAMLAEIVIVTVAYAIDMAASLREEGAR